MKKILFATIFSAICAGANAQPLAQINTTITKGYGNFSIDNVKYPLGSVIMNVKSTDTSLIELDYMYTNGLASPITVFKKRVKYINGTTGLPFTSIGAFLAYYDSFMVAGSSSGGTGTMTSVTYSSPLTGGTITTTGTVSIPAATGSVNGYLKSSDWTIFNNKGSVSSVAAGSGLSGGTITTTGTISMPAIGTPGTYGNATTVPVITTDAQGRVSGVSNTPINVGPSGSAGGDLAGTYPNPTVAVTANLNINSVNIVTSLLVGTTSEFVDVAAFDAGVYLPPGQAITYKAGGPGGTRSGSIGTLSAGTFTVNTTKIASGDFIFVTGIDVATPCGTCGVLSVGNIIDGTSFDVFSSNSLDTRDFTWIIIHRN